MFIKKYLFLLLSIVIINNYSKAQNNVPCTANSETENLINQHPELKFSIEQMQKTLDNMDFSKLEKNKRGQYIVPLVFHVLHNYGTENISDAQIEDAVKILNEDYNKKNADTIGIIPLFKPLIANVGFEFKLANKDPQGNCTNGIDRINSYKAFVGKNGNGNQSKLNQWNRSIYFNIWVVNDVDGVPGSNVLAFALFPAAAHYMFYYDGVIVESSCVGSIGTGIPMLRKTLTHEIGHSMNLQHTWGSTNQPKVACGDDGVQDTPETKGHDNCNILYDSTCHPPIIENVQNYMEYSFCPNQMFTIGQKDRMLDAINSDVAQRKSLWSQQSLHAAGLDVPKETCKPTADFNTNKLFTCIGNNITYTNRSWGSTPVTATAWDFGADATPSTSNSMNPVPVSYNSKGWKSTTLTATSNAGDGSFSKSDYIYVADPVGKNNIGKINSFEDETDFTSWANFNYYHNQFKWEYYTWGGYNGWKSIRYRAFDDRQFPASTVGSASGDIDELITEAYDLSSLSQGNAFLSFFSAGATRASVNTDIDDSLVVQYSINCGNSWVNLVKFTKNQICNNGKITNEFQLSPNTQWQANTFALPAAALTSSTFFKIRYRPGDLSNNFYIDNFEVNSLPVSVKNINANGYTFELIPNPSLNGTSTIQLNTSESGNAQVIITDILGAKIATFNQSVNTGILNNINIPSQVFLQKGIYFVSIDINGKKSTKKLVVQ